MDARHSLLEDGLALLTGASLAALGVFFLNQAGLVSGGTVGLALVLTHLLPFSFGLIFFVLNLPFYALAFWRLGWRFALRTFLAIGLVSLISNALHQWLQVSVAAPLYCALTGGCLIGVGLLILFRHQASLGGFNILALWLQERFGLRAGKVQMGLDCSIVLGSALLVSWWALGLSILAAVLLNLVLTMNHKPGRYRGGMLTSAG